MEETKPKPVKMNARFGGIKVYINESVPPDTLILGYPDGKGGFKDGWVAIRGIGANPPTPPHPRTT